MSIKITMNSRLLNLIFHSKYLRILTNFSSSHITLTRPSWRNSHADHVTALSNIVGQRNILKDDELESFNSDWLRSHKGKSELVVFPINTSIISKILSYCDNNALKCVVQSGNTSLVAGAVPVKDEVIISMKKMNKVLDFDVDSGVLQCEAGCSLQNLEEFTLKHNRIIPYDLGAKGSCLIGGNVATNAGGLRFIKYGPLHGNVLGLEIVLPNGTIIDLMSAMRKDNTGYHLRHLFVGSEGTLGIITKVAILCPIDFKEKIALFIGLDSFKSVLDFFKYIQQNFGEYISCFEMADSVSIEAVVENLNRSIPLDRIYPFHILVELSSNNAKHLEERLVEFLERMNKQKIILNATYSFDENFKNFSSLKSYRELIPEALKHDGWTYKYDISLPHSAYYKCVEELRQRLNGTGYTRICGYGHIGDNNLHFNVTSPKFDANIRDTIEPYIYEFVTSYRGSVSAEHGIGLHKRHVLSYSKDDSTITLMKQIKKLLDPNCTLNPGKLFLD